MAKSSHLYLLALGSNVRTVRDGPPGKVLSAAVEDLLLDAALEALGADPGLVGLRPSRLAVPGAPVA